MIRLVVIGLGALLASWALLVVLATRLPDGTLKELARFLPDCVTMARRLRHDPRVPRRAKVAVAFAGLWVLSPIDLIPEFLPVIGPLDDVVVVALALRYAARQVPPEVVFQAWPGRRAVMERLLGQQPASAGDGVARLPGPGRGARRTRAASGNGARAVTITVLHVADCPNLPVVRERIATAVALSAVEVTADERLVNDTADAAQVGLTGSPTILIDGIDPFAVPGSIPSLSCRLYLSDAGLQGAPTVEALLEVLRP